MKKGVILFVSVLILASFFVIAASDNSNSLISQNKGSIEKNNDTEDSNIDYGYEIKERRELNDQEKINIIRERNELKIRNGSECPNDCSCSGSTTKCEFYDPENNQTRRELTIRAGNSNNTIIQVKNYNASTQVQLYKSEEGRIYGVFKNNKTKEIILPDEVRDRLENRTRIMLHNETIKLEDNGQYNIEAKTEAKLLGFIPVRERIKAQIDAETGEITRTRSSWWGFLAKNVKN